MSSLLNMLEHRHFFTPFTSPLTRCRFCRATHLPGNLPRAASLIQSGPTRTFILPSPGVSRDHTIQKSFTNKRGRESSGAARVYAHALLRPSGASLVYQFSVIPIYVGQELNLNQGLLTRTSSLSLGPTQHYWEHSNRDPLQFQLSTIESARGGSHPYLVIVEA